MQEYAYTQMDGFGTVCKLLGRGVGVKKGEGSLGFFLLKGGESNIFVKAEEVVLFVFHFVFHFFLFLLPCFIIYFTLPLGHFIKKTKKCS